MINKDRIIGAADIVDIIGSRIELKKAGKNWMACCPFHSEKTPSFSVNEQKQFFMCFGCGASGDAGGFLMDYEKLSFMEAMEKLSKITGIPIDHDSPGSKPIVSNRRMKELSDAELTEKLVVAIYKKMLADGKAVSDADKKRASVAAARLREIAKMKMNM